MKEHNRTDSPSGCLTCRARKVCPLAPSPPLCAAVADDCLQVKCDEAPGTCGNCERVLLACRWPQVRNVLDDRATASSAAVKLEVPDGQASSSTSTPCPLCCTSGRTAHREITLTSLQSDRSVVIAKPRVLLAVLRAADVLKSGHRVPVAWSMALRASIRPTGRNPINRAASHQAVQRRLRRTSTTVMATRECGLFPCSLVDHLPHAC